MKTITVIEPSDVRYLRIDVGPRYWEDAIVDGNEDISFEAQAKGAKPLMPFAVFCEDTAKRCKADSYRWQLDIDLKELKIVDWPIGITAKPFYKVCDDGTYYLLDENKNVLMEKNSYVPDILSYKEDGYGDYIDMKIDVYGNLVGFPKEKLEHYIQQIIDMKGF